MEDYFKVNQSLWDQKTPVHLKSEMYDLEGFKKGGSSLSQIELEGLGDVKGKSILHLQCHFGQDSLCWSRLGAKVTGIDLSPKAIETAKNLNQELGLDAEFIQSNVYDLPQNLKGKFDIVFTSYGTICWLPDLKKWASIINSFLVDGGIFYIADFHPIMHMLNWDTGKIEYHYFNTGKPYEEIVEGTYADKESKIKHKEYFWNHSLTQSMSPLLAEGLMLEAFKEFDFSPWECFPNMIKRADKEFIVQFPNHQSGLKIPHVFSMKMRK